MSTDKQAVNLDAVQRMLSQLRNAFLEEMPEKLDRLENLLLAMEKTGCGGEQFDEFYRNIHSLKGSGGTHGLHIITTICHQLEDLLNATEGGTKFTAVRMASSLGYIDLLRAAAEQADADISSYPEIEAQLGKLREQLSPRQFTVLLVDNSKLQTHIYLQLLAELPVSVVVANDGASALMRVLTEPFDLLVTANELSVLNGVALVGALKLSDSRNRNIKTILITSNKKIATASSRSTDPDYIVVKDADLVRSLSGVVRVALGIK